MMTPDITKFTNILEKNRIEALTDGIYAIVLTLSVLMIGTGLYSGTAESSTFYPVLKESVLQIFNYALSFILLSIFWVAHHRQMNNISHVDSVYIWLNMVSLFFITLIPFTTNLNSDYTEYPLAAGLYAANIMLISLSYTASWFYATRGRRLVSPDLSESEIAKGIRRGLLTSGVCIVVIGAAYLISPLCATMFFFLIFVIGFFIKNHD